MYAFSDVIDKADAKIKVLLPAYKKIYKPMSLEVESKRVLDKGYGLLFGTISETTAGTTRHLNSSCDFIVILTNALNLREDNQDIIKGLYNDAGTLVKGFKDGSRLGSAYVIDVGQFSISAPVMVTGEEHLKVEVAFSMMFRELL